MLRSMYSGISGMRVNQTKLDVTGNNIANVGTTAFKGQRVRFQDMLSQNAGRALGASLNMGGVNPKQVGLGVQLAGIDTMVSQGMMQPTGRNLDMAVDGEGYFMVARGPVAFDGSSDDSKISVVDNTIEKTNGRDVLYTRDGSFTLDSEGNLLTSDGYRVLGFSVTDGTTDAIDPSGNINFVDADANDKGTPPKSLLKASEDLRTLRIPEKIIDTTDSNKEVRIISFTVEKNGLVKGVCEGGKVAVLGQIGMSSFKNPAGLEKVGGNLLKNSPNSGAGIIRSGVGADADKDNSSGYGDMMQGALEMSNVDLAEQFTDMITATRAFQAAGKTINTGDEILQDIINLKR